MQMLQPDLKKELLIDAMLVAVDAVLSESPKAAEALQVLRRRYRDGPSRQVFAGSDDRRLFRVMAYDCVRSLVREQPADRRRAWAQILSTALSQFPDDELSNGFSDK